MAMINYADKVALNSNSGIADINKCNATDMNEIKKALNNYVQTGWYTGKTGTTYTYVSWNATTKIGIVSTNQDVTSLLSVGMKVKFTQNAVVKYGIIVAITASQITLFMGTDYTLNNSVITDAYYSMQRAPYGFPMNPDKWTLFSTGGTASINNPTSGVYYNVGGNIVLGVGLWKLSYDIMGYTDASDTQFLSFSPGWGTTPSNQNIANSNGWVFANNYILIGAVQNEIMYNATSEITLYLNVCTNYPRTLKLQTWNYGVRRKAVCAYL